MTNPFGGGTAGVSGERSLVGITQRGVGAIAPVDLKRAFGMGIVAIELPGDLLVGKARFYILTPLHKASREVEKQLALTTATWKEHKVTFKHKVNFGAGDTAESIIYPSGDSESVRIWHYLNGGTEERWAVMSDDWSSKTSPQKLRSGSGSGEAIIKGMSAMLNLGYQGPMEGIYPRDWTLMQSVWGPGQVRLASLIDESFERFRKNKPTKKRGSKGPARKGQPAEFTKSELQILKEWDAAIDRGEDLGGL